MKSARRKITLQLTPLLDLMLIVIFAQYMTMSEQSQHDEARASLLVADAERQSRRLAAERAHVAALRHEAEMIAERALDQRDLVAKLASELFHLPDETLAKLLRQRFPDNPPDEAEIAAMTEEFRRLKGDRGQELVRHLLTFHEIRKRCDVWELYVSETGVTTFKAGSGLSEFRANTSADFAAELFARYRRMPQPKSLVLIVLSYGDVRAVTYEAALSGLPLAIDRLQADAAGRTRFEYAVLGYDPQRPKR
jgi:hypothetical protein